MGVELHVMNLLPGYILKEDVWVQSNTPIVKKETELTEETISVLERFNIQTVVVLEESIGNGADSNEHLPIETSVTLQNGEIESVEKRFRAVYAEAIHEFKKQFYSWQSGVQPNVASLRPIVLPVVHCFNEEEETINAVCMDVPAKEYMYHHPIRASLVADRLAKRLGYSKAYRNQIILATSVMDSGMARVPTKILLKRDELTKKEEEVIAGHIHAGFETVRETSHLRDEMKKAVYQHHERLDGTGYPKGEKFHEITDLSQILAVADVFCALTEKRPYRNSLSIYETIETMRYDLFGKFHLKVIEALQEEIGFFKEGQAVVLSTGERAVIVGMNERNVYRPIVRLRGKMEATPLTGDRFIQRIV